MGDGEILRISGFQAFVGAKCADEWVEVAATVNVVFLKLCVQGITADAVVLLVNEYWKIRIIVAYAFSVLEKSDSRNIV